MLVLSRKRGESIVIDEQIQVKVERISGGQVLLTIVAPRHVPVDRREVWLLKREAGLRSVKSRPK